MAKFIRLPDLEAGWRWPRQVNIHTADIKQECLDWVSSFGAFTPQAQKAFDKYLLAGLMYPRLDREQLRCTCDVMNLFFIFDEHSDISEPADVWNQVDILMDALRNPEMPRPAGEWVGGEIARQFWIRVAGISTRSFQQRFLASWEKYLKGTAQQAEDRFRSHIRTVPSYLEVRRQTIGVMPSLAFFQMEMNLPDEVLTHPTIRALETLAVDLTIIANDVLSYNKEQASGDYGHNLISIIMKECRFSLQEAIDWAARIHAKLVQQFNQAVLVVRRWGGPVDLDIQIYVDGIAQWVGANVQWSFESERYFGKHGLEIKESRILELLPSKVEARVETGPFVVNNLLSRGPDDIFPEVFEMVRGF
ncbi:isoprenoid synthase domain-containing protein [Truncatella angustata]|uniref:Terpene synthase n=1 Tax=Truncatella angustata TaxID=152316 RepID=A0A9P8ZWW3_9PEZI|nr:isoprenoid synthase domain-containing protein [Truncatella angustata]KAH6653461.1 isoprenoid synthase domain-containing protein [Truncatella angustata]